MAVRQHEVPVWARRHPWVIGLITLQAVALTVLSAAADIDPVWLLIPVATVVPAAVTGAMPHPSRGLVASCSAAALLTQALYAIVAFGGSSGSSVLFLSALC